MDGKLSSLESERAELSVKAESLDAKSKSLESDVAGLRSEKENLAKDLTETESKLQTTDQVQSRS